MLKKKILTKKIKFLIIVAGCRAGAELLQSLLDNHHQIIQFPGTIFFNKKFKNSLNLSIKIADNFIDTYPHFFDSRLKQLKDTTCLEKIKMNFISLTKYDLKKIF